MATSCHLLNQFCVNGKLGQIPNNSSFSGKIRRQSQRNPCCSTSFPVVTASFNLQPVLSDANFLANPFGSLRLLENTNLNLASRSQPVSELLHNILLADLDPETAKLAISILGPSLSAFGFLFILRIIMSWYPKLPVGKFPYVIAYTPTEPILVQTRKVIPPVGGVDVTPVVWFGLISFLNEILVGPQGLLVLVSQQQVS